MRRQFPANCEKTSNVCNPSCDYDYRYVTARGCARVCVCVCVLVLTIELDSTANFNNYIYTNNGGEGIACAFCVLWWP